MLAGRREALNVVGGPGGRTGNRFGLIQASEREEEVAIYRSWFDGLWSSLQGTEGKAANDMSAHALNRIVGNLSEHDVYLCASPRLAARVRGTLMDRGFPRHQLHEERFSF